MNRPSIPAFILAAFLAMPAGAQSPAGDPAAGEKVFKKCAACHSATDEKSKIGPHLVGIIGRPAGTIEDFKYSKALAARSAEGLVWTREEIADYLKKPSAKIKGTKMSFPGLKKEKDIADIMSYLESLRK